MLILTAAQNTQPDYVALVPVIQPPMIKLLTTKKERMIRMPYEQKSVSKKTRILFPMSGRIVHKMAQEEDPQNFLLMHSIGVNVSGQIASVIAGGIILNIAAKLMGG